MKSRQIKFFKQNTAMQGWRDSVGVRSSRSGLKSECADIFSSEPDLWLLHHTDVVLMSCRVNFHVVRSPLQYSACRILKYVYIIIFADQVFIDPTFFGIFVCGPLQSLVVNVCNFLVFVFADRLWIFSSFQKSLFIIVPQKNIQTRLLRLWLNWIFNNYWIRLSYHLKNYGVIRQGRSRGG